MNDTDQWWIRIEGARRPSQLATPQQVLQVVIQGDVQPNDEVLGPGERLWIPIEDHPVFADAIAEMGPPIEAEKPDETRLDMNPLIDVALVLLIFFILTTSYASLRRAIDLPDSSPDGKGSTLTKPSLEDRTIRVSVELDSTQQPVIRVENKPVPLDSLESELKSVMRSSNKREVYLVANELVAWGIEAKIHDAIKGAGISKIVLPKAKQ